MPSGKLALELGLLALALLWAPRPGAVKAEFPKDLVPINVVPGHVLRGYPVFRGLMPENGSASPELQLQRLLRVNQTLYVAVRDHVFSFDLGHSSQEGLVPHRVLKWKTRNSDVQKCAMRGKRPDECHNFIRVLVPQNDRTLFVCGTNAFNPVCRNYKMSSLLQEGRDINGQARCPFETKQTNVALFAEGNLYSATMADFLASDAVIYRSLGDKPVLRTVKYDSKWLKEPHFVHVINYGHYVYFFFREIAMEYTALGRVVYSRVARVCKNDKGGSPRVLEKYWTSFLKVRLNCSVPGESFFYFDVLESMTGVVAINGSPTVIGIFSTQSNSIPGSAVCAFSMEDIGNAFNGRFKEQGSTDSSWIAVPEDRVPKPRPGCCSGYGEAEAYKSSSEFPDESLSFIKSHPLLDDTVPQVTERPWLTWTHGRERLSQLVVDTGAGPHQNYTVLFLATEAGRLLKVLLQTQTGSQTEALLLEELDVYNPKRCGSGREDGRPLAMELDRDHHAVYLGFRGCLLRAPLSRCHSHSHCRRACLAARDPYCGWLKVGHCGTLYPGTRSGFEQDVERGHLWDREQCGASPPSIQGSLQDSSYGVERAKAGKAAGHRVHLNLLAAAAVSAFLLGALLSALASSCYWRRAGEAELMGPEGAKAHAEASRIYASLLVDHGGRGAHPELTCLPTPDATPDLPSRNLRPLRGRWDVPAAGTGSERDPRLTGLTAHGLPFIPSAVVLPNNALGRQPSPAVPGTLVEEEQKEKIRGPLWDPPPPPLPHRPPAEVVDVGTLDSLLQRLHQMNLEVLGPAGAQEKDLGPVVRGDEEEGDDEEDEEEEEEEKEWRGRAAYHAAATLPRDGCARQGPTHGRALYTFPKTGPERDRAQCRSRLTAPELGPSHQSATELPPPVPRHGLRRAETPEPSPPLSPHS
ncbi:semaphorin-6D-like isoform X1 [Mobula birostris]|uniref:semaphorin-6D-like isoform X1 n=2 Tax=Mobula birostris TaxID=1983395 RepID=UPI003B282373